MGKKYIMFVDERGFLSDVISNNFSMVGIIFEYDYCIDLKNNQCDLKTKLNQYKKEVFKDSSYSAFLDDIILKEKLLKKSELTKRKKIISELPLLFKSLKFTVIVSEVKQDINNLKDSYYAASKNLLKNFYSFIINNNGECGGIIMEAKNDRDSYIIQQSFFDIYNDRSKNLNMLEDIQDKINTFIVSEKNNKTYGSGIEVLNILNSILFRALNGLREVDNKFISYIEYGDIDKIFNAIKHKIYKDIPLEIWNKQFQRNSYSGMRMSEKELKEQLKLKDMEIIKKQKEINELTNEIQLLSQQLEEALLSRKSDNIIFKILSDIDFKMKGIEKKSRVAEH